MAILVSIVDFSAGMSNSTCSPLVHCDTRLSSTRATLIALFCTFSEVFDVPVYWPILVVYFFTLFALTMRRQIQ